MIEQDAIRQFDEHRARAFVRTMETVARALPAREQHILWNALREAGLPIPPEQPDEESARWLEHAPID
jgi:hypothetical protein